MENRTKDVLSALNDMCAYSDIMWWLSEISAIVEADEEPSIGWVGSDDYVIINAYSAVQQVLYLYAEKEGAIPPFSMELSSDASVYGVDETDINIPHRILYENVLSLAHK